MAEKKIEIVPTTYMENEKKEKPSVSPFLRQVLAWDISDNPLYSHHTYLFLHFSHWIFFIGQNIEIQYLILNLLILSTSRI